jgi:hypothetical protein
MEQLNLKYTGDNYDGFDMEKFKSLIPIGLPTLESQKYIIRLIEKEIEKITKNKIESIKFFNENDIDIEEKNNRKILSECLYNKSRFSIYSYDKEFISKIMTIYEGMCDGFTVPIKIPDNLQGGFFSREIYIHNNNNIELLTTDKITQTGGNYSERKKTVFDLPDEILEKAYKQIEQNYRLTNEKQILRGHQENSYKETNTSKKNKTRKLK